LLSVRISYFSAVKPGPQYGGPLRDDLRAVVAAVIVEPRLNLVVYASVTLVADMPFADLYLKRAFLPVDNDVAKPTDAHFFIAFY
jgi:hypothetical protein